MKRTSRKLVFITAGILFLASAFVLSSVALADVQDVFVTNMPDASNWASEIEARYHLNLESLQDQGENFNVSAQKGKNPQVSLFFNPSDPKPGEVVEAQAFPNFFANKSESLYFTWYLKRRECDLDDNPSERKLALCDLNDDDKITVEDWKIESMRTIASNNFDYTCEFNQELTEEERKACAENMYNEDAIGRDGKRKGKDGDKDGYIAQFGGDKTPDVAHCYIHDVKEGINYELPDCVHLFTKNYKINASGNIETYGQIADSDGVFYIEEEHFWHTDPEDPSTAQNSTKDEANLAGLGALKYRWIYDVGDKVGVAVEGISMYNTKHDDSSNMVMWALPKDDCEVVGKSSYTKSIKGYDVEIPTSTTDIDDCLPDNLVDPTEGGQPGNLDIILSSSPNNPSAKLIPSSGTPEETAPTGNFLSVQASLGNANETSGFLFYSWRVEASKDGSFNTRFEDENVWEDITQKLLEEKNIGTPNGNSLSALDVNLNLKEETFASYFNDGVAYFRFIVNATENFSDNVSRSGRTSMVVKLVVNKSINVYDIETEQGEGDTLSIRRKIERTLCDKTALQVAICPVMRNQIVGLMLSAPGEEIRNYAWTLNGAPLLCDRRVSSECDDNKQGPVNFFPATGGTGSTYTVSVIANNPETGKSFTITRTFQVVDPDFDVVSDNTTTVWPKYLGKYVNLDGSETEDFSKTSFESVPGALASLSIVFRPETLRNILDEIGSITDDPNRIAWTVNGKTLAENTDKVSFPLNGITGATYSVLVEGSYSQPREIRKALRDIWGISPFNSGTIYVSKDIQIYLGFDESEPLAKNPTNAFFASIISVIPTSVLFSIRLMLTIGLLLFGISILFSFAPTEME